MTISRRQLLTSSVGLGLLAAATGCGSDAQTAAPSSPGPATKTTFPVQVTHALGTTVVPAAPRRVVSVGVNEQDALLALGMTPLAVTEWYGDQPYATWPWATDELGSAQPQVLSTTNGFELEKIAALRPDLIVGTNAGMKEADFTKLSALAPTVAHPGGTGSVWFQSWVDQTTLIGAALGRPQRTAALIAAVQQKFSAAATTHPQFAGKKAIFLQGGFYEGAALASPQGLGTDFLTDLGFTIPTEIEPFIKDGAQAYIPLEKLDVLDVADVLIWAVDDAEGRQNVVRNPVYQRLAAVQQGRSVETGPELAGAIYFSSALSLPYVVDQLTPLLADAIPA